MYYKKAFLWVVPCFLTCQALAQVSFSQLTGASNPFNGITIAQDNQIVIGDFDADGDVDFYSWDGTSAIFDFYKNDGSGNFTKTSGSDNPGDGLTRDAPVYNSATFTFVADFDNDGDVDVFTPNYESSGDNAYFRNDAGTFTQLTGASNPFNGIIIAQDNQIVIGDFDVDGAVDFYSWDGTSAIFDFYKNDGSGNFTKTTGADNPGDGLTRDAPVYNSATFTFVADFDNDGDVDVFTPNYESSGDNGYFRNDAGTFTQLTGASNPFNGITIEQDNQIIIGDFDADCDVDFYSWDGTSAIFDFYKNNGSGTFTKTTGASNPGDALTRDAPVYNSSTFTFVADFDNDGDRDVLAVNYESSGDNGYFQLTGSPPSITGSTPADNATGISVDANLVLTFSETVTTLSGNVEIRKSSDNSLVESIDVTSGQVTGSGTTTITINPTSDLNGSTDFYVLIDKATFEDGDNAAFCGIGDKTALNFSTGSSAPSSATVVATVFLEGAFNGTNLNTTLNSDIPLSQPYTNNGHSGGAAGSIPANAVDWVLVELREAGSAAAALNSTKVGSTAGFLMNDGTIKATDGTNDLTVSLTGNTGADFFIVVYHRNHLSVMSASTISESGGKYTVDFTSASANTHQGVTGLASLSGGKFGMIAGDADGDGDVDASDLTTWQSQNGAVFSYGVHNGDFNLDGEVNAVDRNDFQQKNTSKSSQVPTT